MPTRAPYLLLAAMGCKAVDPVPADLDGLVHEVWAEADEGDDATLATLLADLADSLDGETLEPPLTGLVSHLDATEIALVGIEGQDPDDATGVFMARPIACDLELLTALVVARRQDEVYTGVYDEYHRTYTSSIDDFNADNSDTITWRSAYTSTVLGVSYDAVTDGCARRVPALDDAPGGLVARAVLQDPATFKGDASYLDQDYHLEMYWPQGDGVIHVYAMWKDTKMLGFTDEEKGTQNLFLKNMSDWDDGTETLCEQGWSVLDGAR